MPIRRGRGVAAITYPTGMNLGGDPTQARVHSTPSGNFMVTLSCVDLGQGMMRIMGPICAGTIG
ncbi:molybdopterin cofactor-binding domain-containing protein, partial [Mesorhizobium sp. GbtcB19]|uniref:molybdopterin cofactor-binding domain-containing protein n=1 Tax=Mesorhizobium sp. GbtcB19 TaxID=2824764 RepID=UPI001C309827